MTVAEGELQQVTNKFYMFSSLLYLSVFISSLILTWPIYPDFKCGSETQFTTCQIPTNNDVCDNVLISVSSECFQLSGMRHFYHFSIKFDVHRDTYRTFQHFYRV